MTVLGDAFVNVRILGDPGKDLKRKFGNIDASQMGKKVGWSFADGMKSALGSNPFSFLDTDKFRAQAEQARLSMNSLIKTGYFLGPAITAVAGAIGALGSALASLVSVVASATPSLMALGNAMSALLQGAIAVKLAMRGVMEAINIKVGPAPDLSGPLDRVLEARIRLRNLINKEQPERLAAARERAAEAEGRAADALRNSERALRAYNEAQERTYEALENLNKARERAANRIKQLRFETEGAAISEKQARLQFERTRDALQRVQDLPPNSRARQEAELAFAEADLNLRRAIDSNSRLKKEEEAATRAGVEGSDEVVAAKKAIERATQAEEDAQYNAARAYLAAAKARKEADKAAEDAAAGGRVQQEIDADIARARKQLEDALKDLEKAKSSGGADALQKALEDLSPAARDFVLYMREIKKEFRILGDSAATGFFPILTKSVELVRGRLADLAPMFQSTGEAAGNASLSIASAFTEAQTFGNIEKIWSRNNTLIEIFGRAIGNLVRGISALLVAAGPLTERFATWIETITGNWADKLNKDIDGQTERFNRAGDVARDLGIMLKEIGGIFLDLGRIIMAPGGAGDSIITFFTEGAKGVREFLQAGGPDGDQSLVEKFKTASDNGLALLSVIGRLVKILFNLGTSDNLSTFITSLDNVVTTFEDIGTTIDETLPEFGLFLENVAILIKNLTESGGIKTFFSIINHFIVGINQLLENETVKSIFLFTAKLKGVTLAFGALGTVGKFVFSAISGTFIKIFGVIAKFSGGIAKIGLWLANFGGIWGRLAIHIFNFGANLQKFALNPIKMLGKLIYAVLKPIILFIGWPAAIALGLIFLFAVFWKFRKQIIDFVKSVLKWFKDLYNKLVGNSIIPDMVNAIIDWFIRLWDKVKQFVKDGIAAVIDFFKELPGKLLDALANMATTVWEFIKKWHPIAIIWRLISENWDTIKNWFTALPGRIKDTIVGLTTTVRNFIRDNHPILILFRYVRDKWPEVKNWFTEKIASIVDFFSGIKDKIKTKVAGMWDGLKDAFKTALNWIIDKWNNFRIELRIPDNRATRLVGAAGLGFTLDTPNIPRFALGGIVMPRSGGTLGIIGEAGRPERIEPLDSSGLSKRDRAMIQMLSGGGGTTINVYPSAGMDERELANLVSRRLAYEMRTGAA